MPSDKINTDFQHLYPNPMKVHKVEAKTTPEDMKALFAYMDTNGVSYTVNNNPTEEEVAEIKRKIAKADAFRAMTMERILSKSQAAALMARAYETGNFDEIIAHLEEAKKLV